MAKKKKPTKLNEEQLEALQAILNAKRQNMDALAQLTISLKNLEKMIDEKIKSIAGNDEALSKLREALQKEYGDVNINANTGEFLPEGETE